MNNQSQENMNEKTIHQSANMIKSAFDGLAKSMEAEAKKYLDERRKVLESLNSGARIIKHRINL